MSEPISKDKINHLVLNYFIREGHQEAAINFAKEINIDLSDNKKLNPKPIQETIFAKQLSSDDSSKADGLAKLVNSHLSESESVNLEYNNVTFSNFGNTYNDASNIGTEINARIIAGYTTITKRKEIKLLILKGQITEAIQKIIEYFPTILDSNNLLHFKLLRLNLIEMIRNHKFDPSSDKVSQKIFLNDILTFVRERLINKVTNSSKLLMELELTMSLLCFNFDPNVKKIEEQKDLPDELRSLFNLSLRNQCCRVVNQAILDLDSNDANDYVSYQDDFAETNEREIGKNYEGPKYMDFDLNKMEEVYELSEDGYMLMADISETESEKDNEGDVNMITANVMNGVSYDYDTTYDQNVKSLSTSVQIQDNFIQDEELEDELNKLQDLSLESKLEKILKLYVITEQRIHDTRTSGKSDIERITSHTR